jgi:hypothetical protein
MTRHERRRIASEICTLYNESIRSALATKTGGGRTGTKKKTTVAFDHLGRSDRRAFMSAARVCMEEEADAREYVVAQFAVWSEASAFHRKFMLPSPQQMSTEGARVRYLQHKARASIHASRIAVVDDDQSSKNRWFVEERKLRGLARLRRRDPSDVLAEQPEQFSAEFLKHKGIWKAVGDLWEERQL